MSTNADHDVDVLERYFEWREEQSSTGVDVTTSAYREHLRNQQAREIIAEIDRYGRELGVHVAEGNADGSDFEGFHRTVLALIPDSLKEVTT